MVIAGSGRTEGGMGVVRGTAPRLRFVREAWLHFAERMALRFEFSAAVADGIWPVKLVRDQASFISKNAARN
jgi:hypothetical protein